MKLRSLWTPEAETAFAAIVEYLDVEWGHQVAGVFVQEVLDTISLLEIFPNGGILEIPNLGIQSIPVAR